MKRLKPFFPYFGAKYLLAPRYPAPRHGQIVEWYAGSAQYALLHHTHEVWLIEAYAPVAALWRYLIGATEAEILALPDIREGQTVRDLCLPPGPSALIGYWCNGAVARPRQSLAKWARSAKSQLFWGPRVRVRVAAQLPAIRHWFVIEARSEDVAPETVEASHFVDPPYQQSGHAYGVSNVDYCALADRCRTARGQVIVCEADGAAWLPFQPLAEVRAMTHSSGYRTSKEVVWTNA